MWKLRILQKREHQVEESKQLTSGANKKFEDWDISEGRQFIQQQNNRDAKWTGCVQNEPWHQF